MLFDHPSVSFGSSHVLSKALVLSILELVGVRTIVIDLLFVKVNFGVFDEL